MSNEKDDKDETEEKTMGFQVTLDKVTKAKNVTLYSLAKQLGCKPNALSVMKRKGYDPKLSTLVKLSQTLNCPVTDLFEVNGKTEIKAAAKTAKPKTAAKKPAKKAKK